MLVLRSTSQGGGTYENGQKYDARNHGGHEVSYVIALILPEPFVFGFVRQAGKFLNADDSFSQTFAP